MLFTYKAKLKNGEIFEGVAEAADRFAVLHDLKTRGNIPLSIAEKKDNAFAFAEIWGRVFSKIKTDELIIFTKNLNFSPKKLCFTL